MTAVDTEKEQKAGLSREEAAHYGGFGMTTLHKLIREGVIHPVKVYGRTIIPRREIDRLLGNDAA